MSVEAYWFMLWGSLCFFIGGVMLGYWLTKKYSIERKPIFKIQYIGGELFVCYRYYVNDKWYYATPSKEFK